MMSNREMKRGIGMHFKRMLKHALMAVLLLAGTVMALSCGIPAERETSADPPVSFPTEKASELEQKYEGPNEEVSMVEAFEPVKEHSLCRIQPQTSSSWYVNAAVATIWSEPGHARPKDEPSVRETVDLRLWTGQMSLQEKLWLVGKLETQALFGQRVLVDEVRGDWAKVIVPGQATPRDDRGYPGWMPFAQLAESASMTGSDGCPIAVVQSHSALLFDDSDAGAPFMELSFNTRLPVMKETETHYIVATPAGAHKRLLKSDAFLHKQGEAPIQPSGEQLAETGKRFMGLPYLWAGVSSFGFDCSGFTYTIYGFYGIEIPRDAKDQANAGTAVERDALQPGDLLFFAHNNGKGKVHHVGMYAGNGTMVHSPRSGRPIEVVSIDLPDYAKEFSGARRMLAGLENKGG